MRLFAANLSSDVSEKDIRKAFEVFGRVINILLVRRRLAGRSSGVAFLEMPVHIESILAIAELDGSRLKGQAIVVNQVRII